jgi:hypothetical protein
MAFLVYLVFFALCNQAMTGAVVSSSPFNAGGDVRTLSLKQQYKERVTAVGFALCGLAFHRNRWSSSAGTGGRLQSEWLVVFNRNRWSSSPGVRRLAIFLLVLSVLDLIVVAAFGGAPVGPDVPIPKGQMV